MPAVGKSTVGRILAETLSLSFMDTDVSLEAKEGRKLCEIIANEGLDAFCRREEAFVLSIRAENTVISTGGSVIYGEKAMAHLKNLGVVIYLNANLSLLLSRLENPEKRGVVRKEGQSFQSLLDERDVLYRRYADLIADCPEGDAPHTTAARVLMNLEGFKRKG